MTRSFQNLHTVVQMSVMSTERWTILVLRVGQEQNNGNHVKWLLEPRCPLKRAKSLTE
jgi:hypothetical protein